MRMRAPPRGRSTAVRRSRSNGEGSPFGAGGEEGTQMLKTGIYHLPPIGFAPLFENQQSYWPLDELVPTIFLP